jgi:hypothetical protein
LKTRRARAFFCGVFPFAIYSIAVAQPHPATTPTTAPVEILISSGRPLADAAEAVNQICGSRITYEDPPYENASSFDQASSGTPALPRTRVFDYRLNDRAGKQPFDLASALVSAYNACCPTTKFRAISESDSIINVIPVENMNKSGHLVKYEPLLDEKISYSADGKTFDDAAQDICNLIGKPKGMEIGINGMANAMRQANASQTFHDQPARQCLNQLVAEYDKQHDSPILWSFLRDPGGRFAALNFYSVNPPATDPGGLWLYLEADRPLATAARLLGSRCPFPIIYEDPTYQCDCAFFRDKNGKRIGLSGGAFLLQRPAGDPILQTILALTNPNDTIAGGSASARFVAQRISGAVYLRPSSISDEKNAWSPVEKTILENTVSLPAGNRPFATAAADICSQLSAAIHEPVTLGPLDDVGHLPPQVNLQATSASAAQCIVALITAAGGKLDCQLLYDQPNSRYTLEFCGKASDEFVPSNR